MPNTNLVNIPDMTVDEVEQTIYNLDMCLDAINKSLHQDKDMEAALKEQCVFVRTNVASARNKLHTAILPEQQLDHVIN